MTGVTTRPRVKTAQIIVRLSPAEKAELFARAAAARLTVSDYCRDRLLRPEGDVVAELGRARARADAAAQRAAAADRRALQALALGRDD
jgi:hypothetical protein